MGLYGPLQGCHIFSYLYARPGAGGRQSSNTRRLLAIARRSGKPCALVEGAGEIPAALFRCRTVGLCAGASTPDDLTDEIERALLDGCCRCAQMEARSVNEGD